MTIPILSPSPTSPATASAPTAAGAPDPRITSAERDQLIQLLKDSQAEFLAAVSALSDQQWKWKPAPERWSIGECAEHIMLAEAVIFGRAQAAMKNSPAPEWETATHGKTELLMRQVPARLGKAVAPQVVAPSGTVDRAAIMRRFAELRADTLKFVEETQLPLKAHLADHPFPAFNTLNAYQWMLCVPLHQMRHHRQIEEVKAEPGFPAK
jgi:hypothetical protein